MKNPMLQESRISSQPQPLGEFYVYFYFLHHIAFTAYNHVQHFSLINISYTCWYFCAFLPLAFYLFVCVLSMCFRRYLKV